MDWDQYQPDPTVRSRSIDVDVGLRDCPPPVASYLVSHVISFALGTAAAYCLRLRISSKPHPDAIERVNSDESSCLERPTASCPGTDSEPSASGEVPPPSNATVRSDLSEGSSRHQLVPAKVEEPIQDNVAGTSLSQSSAMTTVTDVEGPLQHPSVSELLNRAEYSGDRAAEYPAQLLFQIALDAPGRWTAADYEFVTHCKSLLCLADQDGVQQQEAAMRVERLQQDMWKYMKLQLKCSEVGLQARNDKRQHVASCSSQLQVHL